MSGVALITGISGQDGSYLAESLLADGWEVHGTIRNASLGCAEHLAGELQLHDGDLLEPGFARAALERSRAQQVYHLASPTFVADSWRDPRGTLAAVAGVTAELLEAVRAVDPATRVLVACSREIFGDAAVSPQSEDTACVPSSPYGVAKLAAHRLVGVTRARYELHASSAILFNHESPRRSSQFVTRKITRAAAAISLGLEHELVLGDLDAVRDWSAALDVVGGLRLMLDAPAGGDYVLASGVAHTVGDWVRAAFERAGVEVEGHVRVDQDLVRPREHADPVGDPARAREQLGWRAETSFAELVAEMVDADLEELERRGL
ncbi:MAG: GDP-mannose 4,6-dehydratase [Solirubrobacteraceae bacterium]